jgi:hypothetical protein
MWGLNGSLVFMRNDLMASKFCKCGQGWKPPHEAIQNIVLMILYALSLQRNLMLVGILGKLFWALANVQSQKRCLLQDISGWQIEVLALQ